MRTFTIALTALALAACGSPRRSNLGDIEVHAVRIDSTNVGVISRRGQTVLVDIGLEGAWAQLKPELAALDIDLDDVSHAIITHGHGDHVGDAAAMQEDGIEVLMHELDMPAVEAGENATGEIIGLEAAVIEALLVGPFKTSEPTLFGEDFVMPDLSIDVFHVAGHTDGSVAVVVKDEVAFLGDLMRGGNLGGMVMPELPLVHYFHGDQDVSHQAIRDVLNDYPRVHTLWPAHGGPFTRAQVEQWLLSIGY